MEFGVLFMFIFVTSIILVNFKEVTFPNWNPCCEGCKNSCTDVYFDEEDRLCKSTFLFGGSYEPYEYCFYTMISGVEE